MINANEAFLETNTILPNTSLPTYSGIEGTTNAMEPADMAPVEELINKYSKSEILRENQANPADESLLPSPSNNDQRVSMEHLTSQPISTQPGSKTHQHNPSPRSSPSQTHNVQPNASQPPREREKQSSTPISSVRFSDATQELGEPNQTDELSFMLTDLRNKLAVMQMEITHLRQINHARENQSSPIINFLPSTLAPQTERTNALSQARGDPPNIYQTNRYQPNRYQPREGEVAQPAPTSTSGATHNSRPSNYPGLRRASSAPFHRNSYFNEYHNRESNQSDPVRHFGLRFDGSTSVSDFLFEVEALIHSFHRLFEGKARTWFFHFIRRYPNYTWDILKSFLSSEFGDAQDDDEKYMLIMEKRQGTNESLFDYVEAMIGLNFQLSNPMPEHRLIKIIKKNINRKYSQFFWDAPITTLQQLRNHYRNVETFFKRPGNNPNNYVPYNGWVNELVSPVEDEEHVESLVVAAIQWRNEQNQIPKNVSTSLICWNCEQAGHSYHQCQSETWRKFCYGCGKVSIIKPQYPICNKSTEN